MPAKKSQITDAERAKNMRKLAREVEASDDPKALERAFERVAVMKPKAKASPKSASHGKEK